MYALFLFTAQANAKATKLRADLANKVKVHYPECRSTVYPPRFMNENKSLFGFAFRVLIIVCYGQPF